MSERVEVFDLKDVTVAIYNEDAMELGYDGQTANFTPGLWVTGQTSGATGYIVSDDDQGAAGTLTLARVKGTFQDNETIKDTSSGEALVNGTLDEEASPITSYMLYVTRATLTDRLSVITSHQAGATRKRFTITGHDYRLSLGRFHAKYEEDFGVAIDTTKTYRIKLAAENWQYPSLTETHILKNCVPESRSLEMSEGAINQVARIWLVGDYQKI